MVDTGRIRRNNTEATRRLALDNKACIIMTTADPEVCHIIPFASCANHSNVEDFAGYLDESQEIFFSTYTEASTARQHFASGLGVSDKAWNMISLNQQLHFWWGKPYFGLKYLGSSISDDISMSSITVQFYWLPKLAKGARLERDAEQIKRLLNTKAVPDGGFITASRASGHKIQTGDVFHIKVPTDDADKMKEALNLQWALIRIAALTGGVDAPELDDDKSDDFLNRFRFRWLESTEKAYDVESWLEDVPSGADDGDDDLGEDAGDTFKGPSNPTWRPPSEALPPPRIRTNMPLSPSPQKTQSAPRTPGRRGPENRLPGEREG
jgi:hypothetical protein